MIFLDGKFRTLSRPFSRKKKTYVLCCFNLSSLSGLVFYFLSCLLSLFLYISIFSSCSLTFVSFFNQNATLDRLIICSAGNEAVG